MPERRGTWLSLLEFGPHRTTRPQGYSRRHREEGGAPLPARAEGELNPGRNNERQGSRLDSFAPEFPLPRRERVAPLGGLYSEGAVKSGMPAPRHCATGSTVL